MMASRLMLGCGLVLAMVSGATGAALARDTGKEPPACAAISFRPLGQQGLQEGVQDAGLYRSRHGKIVLRAEVGGGQAKTYFMEINGKRPEPLKGALPAAVNPCLNAKHVKTPAPAIGDRCLGERFRVVVNHVGKQEYFMLFGLQGDTWKLCSASS
jgi:hypothetical protein